MLVPGKKVVLSWGFTSLQQSQSPASSRCRSSLPLTISSNWNSIPLFFWGLIVYNAFIVFLLVKMSKAKTGKNSTYSSGMVSWYRPLPLDRGRDALGVSDLLAEPLRGRSGWSAMLIDSERSSLLHRLTDWELILARRLSGSADSDSCEAGRFRGECLAPQIRMEVNSKINDKPSKLWGIVFKLYQMVGDII